MAFCRFKLIKIKAPAVSPSRTVRSVCCLLTVALLVDQLGSGAVPWLRANQGQGNFGLAGFCPGHLPKLTRCLGSGVLGARR